MVSLFLLDVSFFAFGWPTLNINNHDAEIRKETDISTGFECHEAFFVVQKDFRTGVKLPIQFIRVQLSLVTSKPLEKPFKALRIGGSTCQCHPACVSVADDY
jgi:hypothetical protein